MRTPDEIADTRKWVVRVRDRGLFLRWDEAETLNNGVQLEAGWGFSGPQRAKRFDSTTEASEALADLSEKWPSRGIAKSFASRCVIEREPPPATYQLIDLTLIEEL
jgi:hypothetical protein